jgi:hypothetical protein
MIACAAMPAGAMVLSVGHNYLTQCFDVLVKHPNFYPIPEGGQFPYFGVAEFVKLAPALEDAPFARES